MASEKITLLFRFRHLFTYHPWLKLVSLLIALVLWYFVTTGRIR